MGSNASFGSIVGGAIGFMVGGPVGAAVGAGIGGKSGYEQDKAIKEQKKAADLAAAQMAEQTKLAEKAFQEQQRVLNQQSTQRPNVAELIDRNQQAARGGMSSTMLTGPSGVAAQDLQLGKKTLLGT